MAVFPAFSDLTVQSSAQALPGSSAAHVIRKAFFTMGVSVKWQALADFLGV